MMRVAVLAFFGGLVLPVTLEAATLSTNPQDAVLPTFAPRFVLVPTPAAATSSGMVEFGGPASAVIDLSIKVQQLPVGLYWVVLVRKSDGATLSLAPLSVVDTPDFVPDRRASDNPKTRPNAYQVQVLETQALIKIPAPFDLREIAQVVVQDVNGTAMLRGTPERR